MTRTSFRSIRVAAAALILAAVPAVASAQSSTPVSIAGTWTLGLTGDHVIPTALVVEQTGTSLKATYIFMGREFAFAGEVTGNTFSITGTGPMLGGRGEHGGATSAAPASVAAAPAGFDIKTVKIAETTIAGSINDDGTMAGNLDMKLDEGRTGRMKWTAERLKERKASTPQAASTDGVSLTGAWKMRIVEAQLDVDLDLKHAGNKVTGSATSEHLGKMTLEGTLGNGTLTFTTVGSNAGQAVRIEYSGRYNADGTFAGDLTSQMGAMTWTAARVKK